MREFITNIIGTNCLLQALHRAAIIYSILNGEHTASYVERKILNCWRVEHLLGLAPDRAHRPPNLSMQEFGAAICCSSNLMISHGDRHSLKPDQYRKTLEYSLTITLTLSKVNLLSVLVELFDFNCNKNAILF